MAFLSTRAAAVRQAQLVVADVPVVHGVHFNPLNPIFEQIGIELVPNGAEEGQHVYQNGRELEPERARRIGEAAFGAFFVESRDANINAPMPAEGTSIADLTKHAFDDLGDDADAARLVLEAMSGWTGADLDDVSARWWGFEQGARVSSTALIAQIMSARMRSRSVATASSCAGCELTSRTMEGSSSWAFPCGASGRMATMRSRS